MTVICVTSFKGGTAKTSTILHLGSALARFHNKRVLLIDFDAQANLSLLLGKNNEPSFYEVAQKQIAFSRCFENRVY